MASSLPLGQLLPIQGRVVCGHFRKSRALEQNAYCSSPVMACQLLPLRLAVRAQLSRLNPTLCRLKSDVTAGF
jgi:hypothetical protein